jgi:hypothetical protein
VAVALLVATPVAWASSPPAGAAPTGSSETLVGTAAITGAPVGWQPSNFYLQICPTGEKYTMACAGQTSGSPDQTTGVFSVTVPGTAWTVGMYYYTANGQIMLGKGTAVPPRPGATIHRDIRVAYVVPAVAGTVHLTGAPKNFGSLAYMGVQACPAKASFVVGCPKGEEAYEDVGPGSAYLIDLPRGAWTVAAYYRNFGNTAVFNGVPVTFRAVKGSTQSIDMTIAYQGI